MPRYWFITALGFVIVVSAIINYLNQPIEMAVDNTVAVATATVSPRPASTTSDASSASDIASPSPQATTETDVADVGDSSAENSVENTGQVLATAELTGPAQQTVSAEANVQPTASEALVAESEEQFAEVEQIGGVAESAPQIQAAAVNAPQDTPADATSEIDVKRAAQAVVADAASPPAEDVTSQSSGWLVEASGGLSAADVGQPARVPDGVDTLLSTKSEGIGQPVADAAPALAQPELLDATAEGDDEVAAILAQTASQARRNLGLPEEDQAAPPAPSQVAALADGPDSPEEQTEQITDLGPVAATSGWEARAANVPPSDGPMVAVIIDDLGWSARRTSMVSTLSSELTLAMLTDADDAPRQANQARELGHELLIHVPMQAASTTLTEGSQLDVAMTEEELRQAIDAAVGTIDGAIGINNHMGSLFTADETSMRIVLDQVRRHGLVYVDSLTTADSVAEGIAEEVGVPYLRRDVFLDNERDGQAIADQLAKLEDIAQRRGWAIAIGHPYIETIDALAAWIPTLKRKGIDLIPVSTLIRLRQQDTQTAERPTNG